MSNINPQNFQTTWSNFSVHMHKFSSIKNLPIVYIFIGRVQKLHHAET